MSSIDLHNHYEYQHMNPGHIAVVYSHIRKEYKTFKLTTIGMEKIKQCRDNPPEGVDNVPVNAHRHKDEELFYELALTGLVNEATQVIDLR